VPYILVNIDPTELGLVQKILWPDETVEGTFKQRRIGPGADLVNPSTVIVTDKRVIIVNRATLGFRQDYEAIPYSNIVSVRLEHGLISSSVFIRIQGFAPTSEKGLLKPGDNEGEIDGLSHRNAIELNDYLNKKLEYKEDIASQSRQQHPDGTPGEYCNNCGTKNKAGSRYCSKCGAKLAD